MEGSLRERLESVRSRIRAAAERDHRSASEVTLVAVSKGVEPVTIAEAYRLGQRDFGENRVQEARSKLAALAEAAAMPDARWHLVGHLQSNKARPAVELFDIIESVDSVKLARLLDAHAAELGKRPRVLLQVDYSSASHVSPGERVGVRAGPESQRSGLKPDELDAAAGEIVGLPHLAVEGLMTIASLGLDEAGARAVFRRLKQDRDRLATRYGKLEWRHLSMGMSDDFELAIEEGATIVRVGRAIFGERVQAVRVPAREVS